jgi:hypothetical protein
MLRGERREQRLDRRRERQQQRRVGHGEEYVDRP